MQQYNKTLHQQNQIKVIDEIELQVKKNSLQFSTVPPINDYDNDPRISLTSVHLLNEGLIKTIHYSFIEPLKIISPHHYYYSKESLHMTIKNIKVVSNPPQFNTVDIEKVLEIFNDVIPKYHKFNVHFYRLMLFPHNLSLIGTTDPELDKIVLDLDKRLKKANIPDDKQYVNSRFFFSNITLVRFTSPVVDEFTKKVEELSQYIDIEPYEVDSISLISCNAVLKKRTMYNTWKLK